MMETRVTVLMPVYNSAPYLREAIQSILDQTYSEFCILIINDGSTDNSDQIIKSISDKRIRYFRNEINSGLIFTLNRGLSLIDTEYIARMDADDIALPDRLRAQIEFMDKNPDIAACGTQMEYFGKSFETTNFPLSHAGIKANLAFIPCINHPTAIIRNSVIKKHQISFDSSFSDKKYLIVEDYDFWLKISKVSLLANLPQVFLKYRWEGQNMSATSLSDREKRYRHVHVKVLKELGIEPSDENLLLHLELSGVSVKIRSVKKLFEYSAFFRRKNQEYRIYPEEELDQVLDKLMERHFFKIADLGLFHLFLFWFFRKKIKWIQVRYIIGFYKKKLQDIFFV